MVDVGLESASQTCAGLCAANVNLLRELAAAIRQVPENCYESRAGSQVRHLLDHYRCFLRGDGEVDYQARLRDRDAEIIPAVALASIERIVRELEALARKPAEGELWVAAETARDGKDERRRWRSSRGRELEFLCSHSIHHMAMIRMALKDVIALPEAFGVAPSTLRYWASIGK